MKQEDVLLGVLVGAESAHAFSAFLPSAFTIKTFADTPQKIQALRLGYVPAISFSLLLGAGASLLIDNWWPLIATLIACVVMVTMYERIIAWQSGSAG